MSIDETNTFFEEMFGHEALGDMFIGTSRFPPGDGVHTWHATPEKAAAWAAQEARDGNIYFRTTPVANPPERGRGTSQIACAILGVHADIDIADPVHSKQSRLPPDIESARRIIKLVGLKPTAIVHSGHGLQAHWLFKEPWIFRGDEREAAAGLARKFGDTIRASAHSLEYAIDTVSDLARILRVPGTTNFKADPVPVVLLDAAGPRYLRDEIEALLVDTDATAGEDGAETTASSEGPGVQPVGPAGFDGSDDELIRAARKAKNGRLFCALYDRGDVAVLGGDHSRADWHCVDKLSFWTGPDHVRVDRLFRRSMLFREKWDERHSGDGRTYGEMTIDDVLSRRTTFFKPRPKLPVIVVTARQLRDQTADAIAAIDLANYPPVLFQQGQGLVRVRVNATTMSSSIEPIDENAMVGLLTRAADFMRLGNAGELVPTRPPAVVAKDVLSRPIWPFPTIVGIAESPRVRVDGTVLVKPGYDPATRLWLSHYEGWESFDVPHHPSNDDVEKALGLIGELLCDFPFVGKGDRANAIAFMLTPILRAAIKGHVPVAAFDARSKQGTGKGLLVKVCTIVACGRESPMTAIPNDETEWRKSLTSTLLTGCDTIVYDNAVSSVIESGTWANCITADVFDDRVLGVSKRVQPLVRCTWAITGNGLAFGKDMVRRTYSIMQDAQVEFPEDRGGFKHELPAWANDNRIGLLRAALVLCRRWWSDGCPSPRVKLLGSFEEWTRIIGGVLENVGIEGFLGNRSEFRKIADIERGEWFAFARALVAAFGEAPFTTSMVVDRIGQSEELKDSLPTGLRDALDRQKSFSTKLGVALRKNSGAVFGSLRLADAEPDTHSKKPRFCVQKNESRTETAGGAVPCGTFENSP